MSLWVKGTVPSGHRGLAPLNRARLRSPHQLAFPVTATAKASSTSVPSLTTQSPPPTTAGPHVPSAEPSTAREEFVEKVIYRCRFLAIFGVAGSLMGSVICFLKGCAYVINAFTEYYVNRGSVILMMVEAIDIYLIGTVMLVFGMGLYELFISNIDVAKASSYGSNLLGLFKLLERPKWLEIQSVNELKTKLGHVIVLVLLIGLLEKSKKVIISTPTDLLSFTAAILLSSASLYLLSKLHTAKQSKHILEL